MRRFLRHASSGLLLLPLCIAGCSDREINHFFDGLFRLFVLIAIVGLITTIFMFVPLVLGITYLLQGRPNLRMGVANAAIGGLMALGSLGSLTAEGRTISAGSVLTSLVLAGVYGYVGYRNILLAQGAAKPPSP